MSMPPKNWGRAKSFPKTYLKFFKYHGKRDAYYDEKEVERGK
jgi:hypothetical protein